MLVMTDSREAISILARSIARRFDLEFVAIALPRSSDWDVFEAGSRTIDLDKRQLASAFAAAQTTLEFDAYARTYAGHQDDDGRRPCDPTRAAAGWARSRSVCSPPPAGRSRPARSTRSGASSRSRSSGRSFSRSARRPN